MVIKEVCTIIIYARSNADVTKFLLFGSKVLLSSVYNPKISINYYLEL
jgi:hypothetical protein